MDTTNLGTLADLLEQAGYLAPTSPLTSPANPDRALGISGAAHDSREVEPGNIFVCKGELFELRFLTLALKAGATCYLCDEEHAGELAQIAPEVPALVTNDIRRAMSIVAREAWGNPDREMEIIAITGTKGKTTVAYMIRSILDGGHPRSRAAIMGTIEKFDGVEEYASRQTTPEAPELWRHLRHAADSGLTMVMEASSQGLKHERMDGLSVSCGIFLNIGEDHISAIEHPNFEDYFASKLLLFDHCEHAIVNMETDHLDEVLAAAHERAADVVTCSTTRNNADFFATDIRTSEHGGIVCTVHTPVWTGEIELAMPGAFNVQNALVAIAATQRLGIGYEQTRAALAECRVPGRMELYSTVDGRVLGLVDFAHNPLSFEAVLSSMHEAYPGRKIVALYGIVGGKAYDRRPGMAAAAHAWCDYVILTEDDPGPEDPLALAREVEPMLLDTPHEIIIQRSDAIRRAFEVAEEITGEGGVAVCALGKGDETDTVIGGKCVPYETDAYFVRQGIAAYDACHTSC